MKYLKIYGVYYMFEDSQSFLKMFHISYEQTNLIIY